MIALLDTSEDLAVAQSELGCRVEQLLTPLTRFKRQHPKAHFAIDNGAFSGFERSRFLGLLERASACKHLCRFVAVPDVVGNARRTLECFEHWSHKLSGWKLALVAQDGLEDLAIPWERLDAIFIGGTTKWKLGTAAADVIRAANIIGKWVHAGRVNTPARFEYFEKLGADSIDGMGLSRYTWMRERLHKEAMQTRLYDDDSLQRADAHGRGSAQTGMHREIQEAEVQPREVHARSRP